MTITMEVHMAKHPGMNESRNLHNGVSVHLVSPPNQNWFIKSFDWSWIVSWGSGLMLQTRQIFAQNLGWEHLEFETKDAAYDFVRQNIRGFSADRLGPIALINP